MTPQPFAPLLLQKLIEGPQSLSALLDAIDASDALPFQLANPFDVVSAVAALRDEGHPISATHDGYVLEVQDAAQ